MAAFSIIMIVYLNSQSSQGIGNEADIAGLIEGKDETYLKRQEFVDLLNESHTHKVNDTEIDYINNCRQMDTTGGNKGYPVFK